MSQGDPDWAASSRRDTVAAPEPCPGCAGIVRRPQAPPRGTLHREMDAHAASRAELLKRAREVLDANWTGEATVASRSLYPHQWSWDAAFVAVGRSWSEPARAMQELEAIFRAQWANGMLPHIRFDPRAADYFPGPDFWASDRVPPAPRDQRTSGLTQPPLHARAALEVHRNAGGGAEALDFLRRLFPKLAA